MNTAYYLVFNGLADWEAALALAEIQKSGTYEVRTVGFTPEPVRTMGGVRILPDTTIQSITPEGASILILPGGEMWESGEHAAITTLLRRFDAAGVPIAAICGATLAAAHAGLLDGRRHTSNAADYIAEFVPSYARSSENINGLYMNELAVRDGKLITASGVGSVEFAREIVDLLNIYDAETSAMWFQLFKHGIAPQQSPESHAVA
jgi:putative intracellular protease/amidase